MNSNGVNHVAIQLLHRFGHSEAQRLAHRLAQEQPHREQNNAAEIV